MNPTVADYAKPGDPGCGVNYELCLTKKTAAHYLALIEWSEEIYAKCKKH